MSAVKTLAWSVAAWTGLGMVSVQADSIARPRDGWPWTAFWPAASMNSYQATSAAASSAANPVASPASAPVTPTFAAMPSAPAATDPLVANASFSPPTASLSAPAASPMIASPTPPAAAADAFINLNSTTYPDAATLATGSPQPWYDSPSVVKAFGGVPDAQQQANFAQAVLQDVQHTFQLSGMNPTLTTDSTAPALHTISVVSGASYAENPGAIGITNVGGNGFGFIDKLDYASNPADLAWAVAHNVSHELMHAFGVGYHPDGGNAVDAATANWSSLIDPNMQFGAAATQLLLASQYGKLSDGSSLAAVGAQGLNPDGTKRDGDMELLAVPAPEPATMAMWGFGALGGLMVLRRRAARPAA